MCAYHISPHRIAYQPAQAENQNRGSSNSSVAQRSSHEDKDRRSSEKDWGSTEWLLTLCNVILAVYTARLYYATSGSAEAAKEQSRDTKASIAVAKKSADAAEGAALEAAKSNKLAEDALHSVQRAFVFVQGFQSVAFVDDGKSRHLASSLCQFGRTSGTTPTQHMLNYVSAKFFPGDPDLSFPDLPSPTVVSGKQVWLPVGPKAKMNGQAVNIAVADLLAAGEGKGHVYVWGWAEYDDVFFPKTDRHRTEFCIKLLPVGDPRIPNTSHLSPNVCDRHNGTDRECGQRFKDAQKRRPRFLEADQPLAPVTAKAAATTKPS